MTSFRVATCANKTYENISALVIGGFANKNIYIYVVKLFWSTRN
jgi:hypothetical protein